MKFCRFASVFILCSNISDRNRLFDVFSLLYSCIQYSNSNALIFCFGFLYLALTNPIGTDCSMFPSLNPFLFIYLDCCGYFLASIQTNFGALWFCFTFLNISSTNPIYPDCFLFLFLFPGVSFLKTFFRYIF